MKVAGNINLAFWENSKYSLFHLNSFLPKELFLKEVVDEEKSYNSSVPRIFEHNGSS